LSLETDVREPSDAELLRAVATGDESAYALLWTRHAGAARRLAAQLTRPSNVDDLVSEAFLRVLRAVKGGGGPDTAFRPYLFNTMRRFTIDAARSYHQRVTLTDDDGDLDVLHAESAGDVYSADAEQQAAWLAWQSLPEESRTLLWHLIVEEETPAQIAPLLGVSANGVSSRAVRARERLRQAFLAQHVAHTDDEECRRTRTALGGYVRDALSARDRAAVELHLADCRHCAAALTELRDVNMTLRMVIAPLVLGGAAVSARYLTATHHAAAAGTVAVGKLVALRSAARFRHLGAMRNAVSGAKLAVGGTLAASAAAVVTYVAVGDSGTGHPAALGRSVTSSASRGVAPLGPTPSGDAGGPGAPGSPAGPGTPAATRGAGGTTADPSTAEASTASPTRPVGSLGPTSRSAAAPAPAPTPSTTPPKSATSTPRPTPSSTPSATPTPTPPPSGELVRRGVRIDLSSAGASTRISTVLPAGWRIVVVKVGRDGGFGAVIPVGGDGVHSGVWLVSGSAFALTVEGPRAPSAVLHVQVADTAVEYPLN
jgi:RNA polymerase sigma factor (sigma-70 family)